VRFDVGDAERLAYADSSFEVVSYTHGVVFAADPSAVARELGRVCRPGARLGITYWLPNPELLGCWSGSATGVPRRPTPRADGAGRSM
jgi:ubiquinone/menaquinone biosynthesis C-methylase UbiE